MSTIIRCTTSFRQRRPDVRREPSDSSSLGHTQKNLVNDDIDHAHARITFTVRTASLARPFLLTCVSIVPSLSRRSIFACVHNA